MRSPTFLLIVLSRLGPITAPSFLCRSFSTTWGSTIFFKMSRRNFIVAFVVPVDGEKRAWKVECQRLIYRFADALSCVSSIRNSKFNAGYSSFLDRRKPALGSLSFRDLIHRSRLNGL